MSMSVFIYIIVWLYSFVCVCVITVGAALTNLGPSSTSHSDAPTADVLAEAGGEDSVKLRLSARASSMSSMSPLLSAVLGD